MLLALSDHTKVLNNNLASKRKKQEKGMDLVWMIEWQLEFNNISLLDINCIYICKYVLKNLFGSIYWSLMLMFNVKKVANIVFKVHVYA